MPTAFKAALDISPTVKVLSARSGLTAELVREGVVVPPEALQGDAQAISNLFEIMRTVGLDVVDIQVEAAMGKKRVLVVVETEGSPPAYRFSPGDTFYDPPEVSKIPWSRGLRMLRRYVQISSVDGDQIRATLRTYEDGVMSHLANFSCSQREFASLLRTGTLDAVGGCLGVPASAISDACS